MPRAFSDQDVEHLARELAKADGAQSGDVGWGFVSADWRDRYRRYARTVLRAGYRLPTDRVSAHQRITDLVARVEVVESALVSVVQQVEQQRERLDLHEVRAGHREL